MAETKDMPAVTGAESPLELFLLHLRYKEGRLLPLEGNAALMLDDPDSVWVVYAGKVDIFSVRQEGGQSIAPRRHVVRLEPGQIFFGMDLAAYGQGMGLLATGVVGTHVLRLTQARLREMAEEPEFADLVVAMLDTWIAGLSAGLNKAIPPKALTLLEPTQETGLRKDAVAIPRQGVLWIKLLSGRALLANRQDLPPVLPNGFVPLSQATWLRAIEDLTLVGVDSASFSRLDRSWHGLAQFHARALQAIRLNLEEDEAAERGRIHDRLESERRVVGNAFADLASLLNPKSAQAAGGAVTETDALFAACGLVANALRIDLQPALRSLGGASQPITVRTIARAANLRVREVSLKGHWWRTDSGPILASLENGQPVALVPISPTSYALHDVVARTVESVTATVAARLAPHAYTFYRPFPDRPLSLWGLLRFGALGTRRDLGMVLFMGVAAGLLGLVTPIATQRIFDDVLPSGDKGQLLGVGLFLAAIAVASALFQITRSVAILRVEGRLDASIQAAIWDRLLNLPAPFFRQYSAGDLGSRAMGINAIRQILSGPVTTTILSAIFSSFNVVLLFYYDAVLALAAIGLVVVAVAVTTVAGYLQVRYQRKLAAVQGHIAGLLLQVLNGIAKFRVIGGEDRAFVLWADRFIEQRRLSYKARTVQNNLQTFNAAYPVITSLTIFAVLALTHGGGMTTGAFIAFNAAFAQVLANALQVSGAVITILSVIPLYERAKPILHTLPEVDEAKASPGELSGAIEVSHASFRYSENGPLVLQDVSIAVQPGEMVALVGPSGSGKSTLLRLLLGFEEPESGGIYYDSQDLKGLNVREVRQQIGTVIQNGKVMSGLLLQNITGSSQLTIDDAWEAARMAGLEEDIKRMPMGMFTMVSEEGGTFSGGQRQRLMIARALANKPRIVFFDEATSALDNRTQEIVTRSMEGLHATRVVIAHRLSTIINADRIYVLRDGRVLQSGTYNELMQQPGLFADLAKRQMV
jgi:NHLM bacteriocin system ABC transporter ATP-binding protein